MTEALRKIAREEAAEAIREHSISVLGHDPDHPGSDDLPRDTLAWARTKKKSEERRHKYMGAAMLAAAGAIGTLVVNQFWARIAKLLGL